MAVTGRCGAVTVAQEVRIKRVNNICSTHYQDKPGNKDTSHYFPRHCPEQTVLMPSPCLIKPNVTREMQPLNAYPAVIKVGIMSTIIALTYEAKIKLFLETQQTGYACQIA